MCRKPLAHKCSRTHVTHKSYNPYPLVFQVCWMSSRLNLISILYFYARIQVMWWWMDQQHPSQSKLSPLPQTPSFLPSPWVRQSKGSFTSHCTQFSLTNYSVNSDGSSPSQSKISNTLSQTVKAFGLTKLGPELQSTKCYKGKKKLK